MGGLQAGFTRVGIPHGMACLCFAGTSLQREPGLGRAGLGWVGKGLLRGDPASSCGGWPQHHQVGVQVLLPAPLVTTTLLGPSPGSKNSREPRTLYHWFFTSAVNIRTPATARALSVVLKAGGVLGQTGRWWEPLQR